MEYGTIHRGIFLERPNRFIANVQLPGQQVVCHVKNTGRCRELLVPGYPVYLEENHSPSRKTAYDLVCVQREEKLINLDSQAPNRVVREFLESGGLLDGITCLHPEYRVGDSRLDFMIQTANGPFYLEVKGVTLEENGTVLFPDAPTQRGIKHIQELIRLRGSGAGAGIFFVIQMQDVLEFRPNYRTHPEFGQALAQAHRAGVELYAYDCTVTPGSLQIRRPVPICLE